MYLKLHACLVFGKWFTFEDTPIAWDISMKHEMYGFYDKMVGYKMSLTKCYGQNGTDRIMN